MSFKKNKTVGWLKEIGINVAEEKFWKIIIKKKMLDLKVDCIAGVLKIKMKHLNSISL